MNASAMRLETRPPRCLIVLTARSWESILGTAYLPAFLKGWERRKYAKTIAMLGWFT